MYKYTCFILLLVFLVDTYGYKQEHTCPTEHEFYSCGSACDTKCETLGEPCPIVNKKCVNKCYCKEGFARNNKNVCIPISECPAKRCTGKNEMFACGSACDNTCKTLGQTCSIVNIKCVDKCYCKTGFARNDQNICIPISECPAKKCKGKNEIFSCGSACDNTCATLGQDCPIINIKCNDMCYCKEGFARNGLGVCVPTSECLNQTAESCLPETEFFDCGSACDTVCNTLGRPCPIVNITCNNKCYCKKGYARNHLGVCVLIENCS